MCAQIQFSVGAGACGRPRASLFSPVESIAGSWSSKSSMRTGPLICDAINGRRLKRATPGQPGGEATAAAMAVVRIRPMSSIFFRTGYETVAARSFVDNEIFSRGWDSVNNLVSPTRYV